jgi:hypothetical protein
MCRNSLALPGIVGFCKCAVMWKLGVTTISMAKAICEEDGVQM